LHAAAKIQEGQLVIVPMLVKLLQFCVVVIPPCDSVGGELAKRLRESAQITIATVCICIWSVSGVRRVDFNEVEQNMLPVLFLFTACGAVTPA